MTGGHASASTPVTRETYVLNGLLACDIFLTAFVFPATCARSRWTLFVGAGRKGGATYDLFSLLVRLSAKLLHPMTCTRSTWTFFVYTRREKGGAAHAFVICHPVMCARRRWALFSVLVAKKYSCIFCVHPTSVVIFSCDVTTLPRHYLTTCDRCCRSESLSGRTSGS